MEDSSPAGTSPEDRFRLLYAATYPDVLRFAARRVHPTRAEDVVAEAFLVVWRRVHDLPTAPDDARAWIYGITRNLLLNDARGERRRRALAVRLAQAPPPSGDPEMVALRLDLAAAWERLSATDQEVIALTTWDGLDGQRAAAVMGISPVAYRLRLSRARRALRRHADLAVRHPATSRGLPERGAT